jgi:tRNA dimethylallyltransferase
MKPIILCLAGPTASGKSALAMLAARELGGEVVCMDSMQVYRRMDIGTAKPTSEEQRLIPHHMLDVAEPGDAFSVAEYAAGAGETIQGILSRGKLPVLCGGTGLYLRALSKKMDFGGAPADLALREKYQQFARERGAMELHTLLEQKDPQSAARLHPNDLRRVIRALEVQELTGQPFSAQEMPGDEEGPFDIRLFAIAWHREELYRRVEARVGRMLAEGLAEEVRGLLDSGVKPESQSMQGLGYKELVPCLQGETTLEDAAEKIARRTRNYAKRQLTWFRADKRIHWLPSEAGGDVLLNLVREGLEDI